MTIELAFRSADEAKQFEIIAALTEGTGIRATARITGVNRETVGTLALRVASVDWDSTPDFSLNLKTSRVRCPIPPHGGFGLDTVGNLQPRFGGVFF
jgi:hypothetical protein